MSPTPAPVSMENTQPSHCNQLVPNLDQAGPDFKIGPPTLEIEKYSFSMKTPRAFGGVMNADPASKIFLRLVFILQNPFVSTGCHFCFILRHFLIFKKIM